MPDFAVAGARWLINAGAGFKPDQAAALLVKLDPDLEHINQLKLQLVEVAAARA